MIDIEMVERALNWMRDNAEKLGKAKAERVYLEQFRKSKKAILFSQAPQGTIADKENWAYAHDDYLEILDGLKIAVAEEEELKWLMTSASVKVDVWRTQSATNRALDRAHT